jgi:hypothetical protein
MNRRTASPVARRSPAPHRDHCPMSGKVRYRDAREATDALHALTNQASLADQLGGQHTIRVQRKYQCNACRGWHLTSQATWGAHVDAQSDSLPVPAGSVLPAPRRSDPLLAALARSLDQPGRGGVRLAA